MKSIYLGFLMLGMSLSMVACAGGAKEEAHGDGKEYTSAYVCPMHCDGSGSEEPGECPVCGMDYETLAYHTEDEHEHN